MNSTNSTRSRSQHAAQQRPVGPSTMYVAHPCVQPRKHTRTHIIGSNLVSCEPSHQALEEKIVKIICGEVHSITTSCLLIHLGKLGKGCKVVILEVIYETSRFSPPSPILGLDACKTTISCF